MHDRPSKPLRRDPFSRDSGAPSEGKWEQAILRLLLAQDGSTTRLLETMAGAAISVQDLKEGIRPIGHVLSDVWIRRTQREQDRRLLEELWSAVGEPDLLASRSQCIHTLRAPCMLVAETFRRGVLAHIR